MKQYKTRTISIKDDELRDFYDHLTDKSKFVTNAIQLYRHLEKNFDSILLEFLVKCPEQFEFNISLKDAIMSLDGSSKEHEGLAHDNIQKKPRSTTSVDSETMTNLLNRVSS